MNIYLDMIGCRLNQSEIETFARQFRIAGHTLVSTPEEADLAVINTCTVTAQAAADSRQKIRQAAHAGVGRVVVTGCWATMQPAEASTLPGVYRVVANQDKERLVADVLQLTPQIFDHAFLAREPIPGERSRTRAFIKAQDGCDNHCTYCVTVLARGSSRSRSIPDILKDIQSAQAGGVKEIVLTGVHLGSWGLEQRPVRHLEQLVQAILTETDLQRLRLSSLEPWDLDERFFALWQDTRLCRHIHLPLQSGSAATLQRMGRKTSPHEYARLVDIARQKVPDLAVTTDIIVGFPGENEAEFAESLAFIQEMNFAGGHVFTYSPRPGTAAVRLPGQVPHPIARERSAILRHHFARAAQNYQSKFIGKRLEVLWESSQQTPSGTWQLSGLTDNYLHVTAQADTNLWNQISLVHLTAQESGEMQGIICAKDTVNL
jgi:threonylcarbamoyladenosine tRNA methylthiotransferase MtaB